MKPKFSGWMLLAAFLLGCICVSFCKGNDLEAARIDRSNLLYRLPSGVSESEVHSRYFYFSFASVPNDKLHAVVNTFKFAVSSATRERYAGAFIPVQITPTLYRIDVVGLGWEKQVVQKLMQDNKYKRVVDGKVYPVYLVNHPWFIMELLDSTESDAYNLLVWGKADPTRDDFITSSKANTDPTFETRKIEGKSGVSNVDTRDVILSPNALGTLTTYTADRFEITAKNSPLQSLETNSADLDIDGSEGIYAFPIFDINPPRKGYINRYGIWDGDQKFIDEANERLVSNSFGWRGHHTIVSPGGCVNCHQNGLNPITLDFFAQYITNGGQFIVKDPFKKIELERKLLMPVNEDIAYYNEKYAIGINIITGMQPKDFIVQYNTAIQWLDAPIGLDTAAKELFCTSDELKNAIAIHDPYTLHEGYVRLVKGMDIERTLWEDLYTQASIYLEGWRNGIKK